MDPNQPPAAPQPQWTPPPQQPMGWGGPGYGGSPPRPTGVTLASIYLIVMGVLTSLLGGCAMLAGTLVTTGESQLSGLGAVGTFIAGLGIFIVILGVLGIVAGAGALGGKSWGRWTGIIISVVFAILLILGGVSSFTVKDGATGGATSVVFGVLYALSAWALIQAGPYFSWRR